MNSLPELLRLFTRLASGLRRSNASTGEAAAAAADYDGDETPGLVSSLTRSLNYDDQIEPRVRVLDATLSLMCFKTPEVCGAQIECLVGTIVSVLSSSVSCKVLRPGGADVELLQVGSSMSTGECDELIRACADVLGSLNGHSGLSFPLLYGVLKAAISSSSYQVFFPLLSTFCEENEKSNADRKTAILKLMYFLPDETSVSSHEIPLRLILWYLDPLILKHDISEILREAIQRPFLCLNTELHDRMPWRSIIICLVTSPTIFIEARALLHNWFLVTGSTSVLELQIAVVSAVLDVLSRPMWWGSPMELGLGYLFPRAYFPNQHGELLAILSGHISCERFLDLVSHIGTTTAPTTKLPDTTHPSQVVFWHDDASANTVDYKSCWAMVLQFPAWFYFAISLIFCGKISQDSHLAKLIYGAVKPEETDDSELHQAANRYISWVLSPTNEAHRCLLADLIQEISKSWTRNKANSCIERKPISDTHSQSTLLSRSKKLRIPKVSDCEKLHSASEDDRGSRIGAWLRKFSVVCRTGISYVANMQPNSLFMEIPLGILISCSSYLDETGCELLLHYVVTGETLRPNETQEEDQCRWALDGARLVFRLFDVVEDMSVALFDDEDDRLDYFCQLKGKASRYLLRCVTALLEPENQWFQNDGVGGRDTMADLLSRLKRWMQQGRGVFEGCRAFDVVGELARRFPLSNVQN